MKNDLDRIPDATDIGWIESIAPSVHDDPRFTATILPLGDGLLEASCRGASA